MPRTAELGEETFVLVKELEDGSRAVGLCNRGECEEEVVANWKALGVTGRQRSARRMATEGSRHGRGTVPARVPRHGVVLIRLFAAP